MNTVEIEAYKECILWFNKIHNKAEKTIKYINKETETNLYKVDDTYHERAIKLSKMIGKLTGVLDIIKGYAKSYSETVQWEIDYFNKQLDKKDKLH